MNLSPADHIVLLARDPHTRVLALDLGNQCGWADHLGHSGIWSIWGQRQGPRPSSALEDFAALVARKINELQPQVICYEQISAGHGKRVNFMAVASLRELLTTLKLVANQRQIPLKGFNIISIKAFAAHGRAKKPEMIAAYRRHYGVDIFDHNQCDAAWIARYFPRPDIWLVKELEAAEAKGRRKKKPKKCEPQGKLF